MGAPRCASAPPRVIVSAETGRSSTEDVPPPRPPSGIGPDAAPPLVPVLSPAPDEPELIPPCGPLLAPPLGGPCPPKGPFDAAGSASFVLALALVDGGGGVPLAA